MTLKNKYVKEAKLNSFFSLRLTIVLMLIMLVFNYASCKYSFKDTSPIPEEVQTFRVNFFENKARYVNPQ